MIKLLIWFRPFAAYFLAAWVAFIVIFSSIPSLPVLKIHTSKSEIRLDYLIHVIEYGVLAFLALLTWAGKEFDLKKGKVAAIIACVVLFSLADEYHQKFIPGRTLNIIDIYSNITGILLSTAISLFLIRVTRRIIIPRSEDFNSWK